MKLTKTEERETSFLAYIARQYRRQKEDVGTDALAYLLQRDNVQAALFGLVSALGYKDFPAYFSTKSRTRGSEGTPDLLVLDKEDGACRAIIEVKFWANLTKKQPLGYFKLLRPGGLILFIAPKKRDMSLWAKLCDVCVEGGRGCDSSQNRPRLGRSEQQFLALTSWEDVLQAVNASPEHLEVKSFVTELRRLLRMAEQDDEILPVKAGEINDRELARKIQNLANLAIAITSVEDQPFKRDDEKKAKKDAAGSGWSGSYGSIAGHRCWIGFAANTWAERGITPIWIAFEGKMEIDRLRHVLSNQLELEWFIEERPIGDMLVIPVMLRADVQHDELIASAIDSIKQTAAILTTAPKSKKLSA